MGHCQSSGRDYHDSDTMKTERLEILRAPPRQICDRFQHWTPTACSCNAAQRDSKPPATASVHTEQTFGCNACSNLGIEWLTPVPRKVRSNETQVMQLTQTWESARFLLRFCVLRKHDQSRMVHNNFLESCVEGCLSLR